MVKKLITFLMILIMFFYCFQSIVMATDVTSKEIVYDIKYKAYVQYDGWQNEKLNGQLAGTEGKSKRLEAIQINVDNIISNAIIEYQVHVQNIGWQEWKKNGQTAGTYNKGLRLEAIKINLKNLEGYSVEYRVHIQNLGWQKWKKNGEIAGTTGQALRIEAIQIIIVKNENLTLEPEVTYQAHAQLEGWQEVRTEETLAGTTNQSLRLEALKINLLDAPNAKIEYQAHVQNVDWQSWKSDGQLAGTTDKSLRLEALKIRLKNLDGYSVYYRVHVQNIGWQGWKKNGETAGTTGQSLRIEAIEIKIVKEKTNIGNEEQISKYTYGIDVSKHQGVIDWKAVASTKQVDFAFIRAGFRGYGEEGTLNVDPRFSYNVKNANKEGIKVGTYFFSQAINVEEAKEEAYFLLDILKGYNITYPVAIDVEYATTNHTGRADGVSKEMRTQICIAFLTIIENAGYKPMIYADKYFATDNLDMSKLQKYDFWMAHYTGATQSNPLAKPSDYKGNYAIWQYSSKGKINGINGDVDLNIGYKTW